MDVRDQAKSIEAMSLYSGGNLGVQLRDHSVYTGVTFVDANFAHVFSLQPIAGRTFTDADAHHAVLVSEQFARDHFGSTQAALGQMLQVESEPVEIVGVLPGGFDFPAGTQVWEAFPLRPASEERTAFNYKAVARLRSGTTFQAARTELIGISRRLETAYPEANRNKQLLPQPLHQALTRKYAPDASVSVGCRCAYSADRVCQRDPSSTGALAGAPARTRHSQGPGLFQLAAHTARDPREPARFVDRRGSWSAAGLPSGTGSGGDGPQGSTAHE